MDSSMTDEIITKRVLLRFVVEMIIREEVCSH